MTMFYFTSLREIWSGANYYTTRGEWYTGVSPFKRPIAQAWTFSLSIARKVDRSHAD